MTTDQPYSEILEQFRANIKHLERQYGHINAYTSIPGPLEDLFSQFIDKNPSKEDWMNLLKLLVGEEARDYDSIAHYFL